MKNPNAQKPNNTGQSCRFCISPSATVALTSRCNVFTPSLRTITLISRGMTDMQSETPATVANVLFMPIFCSSISKIPNSARAIGGDSSKEERLGYPSAETSRKPGIYSKPAVSSIDARKENHIIFSTVSFRDVRHA